MTVPTQPPQSLDVELPLTTLFTDYSVQLKIKEHTVPVSLDLSGGPKEIQSDPMPVGSFDGVPVMAQISFQYDYNVDSDELTIHGNDDQTEDQLRITIFLQDAPRQLSEQRIEFRATPNNVGSNSPVTKVWADYVGTHTAFHARLMDTARRCNETLVDAAIRAGIGSVVEIGTAPTVTLDNLDDFKRMFGRPIEAEASVDRASEVAELQDILRSTYVGTVTWAGNTDFANVIGSTLDPKVTGYNSWIGLWQGKCNNGNAPTYCTSRNWFSSQPQRQCSGVFVGGHVIPGTQASEMEKGDPVYIYPICSGHNGVNSSYMHVLYNARGVKLNYWET
ncbi:hypothetical protein [Rhizobium sp. P44RR-XXIV]|uniref:hypothetical protein n=1 Tax=Rhizobium sp. P44RR-XXIV TaxID=1921145 RepID=UPI0009863C2B|nr:hypothetical protein [Rhizobium sp. P44RR-XXIV]TIX90341.1 hypothetical protein BSK43_013690 [Rhizobium sp. P44RR-XXIV]